MKINPISHSVAFGANLSRGVQKMITKAQQVCTEAERPLVEDAVKILKECCPEATLATQKKMTHILVKSDKPGNLWGYFYVLGNSKRTGEPVTDLRRAAAALEFMHIGGVKPLPLFGENKVRVSSMPFLNNIDGKFTRYYEKWSDFFKNNP